MKSDFEYDITLVNMPFAMPVAAPLGIGVLCGALRRAGFRVRCLFPNIDLAERIPEELYAFPASNGLNVDIMLGDWLFADLLFGPDAGRDRKFLAVLKQECDERRILWNRRYHSFEELTGDFPLLRREAARCVEKTAEKIVESGAKSRIAGCSSTFFQRLASLALLKKIKELQPDIVTFLGGADCEGAAALEAAERFPFLDYVFSGEGDLTVPEMVKQLVQEQVPSPLPEGVFDRAKAAAGRPETACVPGSQIADPDFSAYYERMKTSRLKDRAVKKYFLETSRGCWKGERQHCSFCGLNGERIVYRRRPPERVLAELRKGYFKYGCRVFLTSDTVLDLQAMRDTLRTFAAEAPDAVISYETVSTLTEEQIKMLADCGVLVIQSGIETLHPKHVKLLNKGNDVLSSIALLKFAQENRVQVIWNMLTGIPGDAPEDYLELREFLVKLYHLTPPNWGAIRFDRFSVYSRDPDRFKLKLAPMKCYRIILPEGAVDLNRWALFYDNLNPSAATRQEQIPEVREQVRSWNDGNRRGVFQLSFVSGDTVKDTRPCAVDRLYHLDPAELAALEAARSPAVRGKVEAVPGVNPSHIEEMKKRGFLLELNGKLLALPLKPAAEARMEKCRTRYRNLIDRRMASTDPDSEGLENILPIHVEGLAE